MEIAFQRVNERQSFAVVRRDDGVSLRVPGYGPALPLPHDLAHYVVEHALGLQQGFWGSVAEGCVFPGMQHLAGRRKPHADERSRAVMRANGGRITQAEVLVGALLHAIVLHALDREPQRALSVLAQAQSACAVGAYPLTADRLRAVCAELRTTAERWQHVGLEGALAVTWQAAPFARGPRSTTPHRAPCGAGRARDRGRGVTVHR